MRNQVVTDLNDSSKYRLRRSNQIPKNFVCFAPEVSCISCLDILDDIDEQGEVIGKKAVVNQAKLAAYEANKLAEQNARQVEQDAKAAKLQALKDSVSGFNSKTAAEKWAVVKTLLEHIVGE